MRHELEPGGELASRLLVPLPAEMVALAACAAHEWPPAACSRPNMVALTTCAASWCAAPLILPPFSEGG